MSNILKARRTTWIGVIEFGNGFFKVHFCKKVVFDYIKLLSKRVYKYVESFYSISRLPFRVFKLLILNSSLSLVSLVNSQVASAVTSEATTNPTAVTEQLSVIADQYLSRVNNCSWNHCNEDSSSSMGNIFRRMGLSDLDFCHIHQRRMKKGFSS